MKLSNIIKFSFLITVMALVISVSPSAVFAKNGDNNKEDKIEKRIEKTQEKIAKFESRNDRIGDNNDNNDDKDGLRKNDSVKKCRAFGHFFARGWIKNFGWHRGLDDSDCRSPFGIWKNWQGGIHATSTATTTIDTVAPNVSSLKTKANLNSASIYWSTNEKADGTVFYSTSSPAVIGDDGTKVASSSPFVKDHRINLSGLSASTTYYFLVRSSDKSGNATTTSEASFVTKVGPSDNTAPNISSIVAVVGTSTANITWDTNELATSKVYYSTSTPVDTLTAPFLENTSLVTDHSLSITGLSTSTTYRLIVESKDSTGNVKKSSQVSITTHSN